ncbi:hypothetical protein AB0756_39420 [Tolypothrix campylonemoides VB511288_2]|uniref:Uncharacterized protein n=2 Tax=Nostocales TaxID=1161 RepID=A0ABW8WJU9_9CYAN
MMTAEQLKIWNIQLRTISLELVTRSEELQLTSQELVFRSRVQRIARQIAKELSDL